MEEPFAALGGRGNLGRGKKRGEFAGQKRSVAHAVLRGTGVDHLARDLHDGARGVEILVLELAELAAVDRVGKFGTELLHIEEIGTATHLLIRGEADGERSVGSVGVLVQVLHERHDLRHARLVVGAEQRGTVGHDKIIADMLRKRGEVLLVEHHAELLVDDDGAALVVLNDAGVHALAARLGGGVHMGDETDSRSGGTFGKVGGDMAHHIAVLIDARVFHAEGL